MSNEKLSNDDFRKFLDSSATSAKDSVSKQQQQQKPSKRKYIQSRNQFGSSNWKQNDPNYRDRAQERRKADEDKQEERPRGLDFEQLARDRESLEIANKSSDRSDSTNNNNRDNNKNNDRNTLDQDDKSINSNKKELNIKSQNAKSIYKAMQYIDMKKTNESQTKKGMKTENFLPGRMTYVFDLDPHFSQYLPNTTILSKDDCPPQRETLSGKIDTSIIKKLIKLFSPNEVINEQSNKNNNNSINSNNNNIIDNNDDKSIKQNIIKKEEKIESMFESDDDIFSDAEEYVCEKAVKENEKKKTNYFSKKESDEIQFKPIGKEGDEDEEAYPDTDENYKQGHEDGELGGDEDGDYQGPSIPENVDQYYQEEQSYEDEDEEAYPDTDQNYQDTDQRSPTYSSSSSDSEDEVILEIPESLKRKMDDGYSDIYKTNEIFANKIGEKSKELDLLKDSLKKEKTTNKKQKSSKSEDQKLNKQMQKIDNIFKKEAKENNSKYYNILEKK